MESTLSFQDLLSLTREKRITTKQMKYGLSLGLAVTEETLQSDFTKIMSEKKSNTLTVKESYTLLETLSLTMIRQILRRPVEYISEITKDDYRVLMKVAENPRSLWIQSKNHPVIIRNDWEYGWQESKLCKENKLWYLKSHDYFMADIDSGESRQEIFGRVKTVACEYGFTFRIYKTYAGYHVHLTSHCIPSNSDQATALMCVLKSDIWYQIYSQRCGYKIRVSEKIRKREKKYEHDYVDHCDDEGKEEEVKDLVGLYVGVVGSTPENSKILEYLQIMEKFISQHEHLQN